MNTLPPVAIPTASVLAIIPARGGSKGITRKNLRELLGKPLIQYPIETARQSRYIDRIVVSTDDPEIGEVAQSLGVEVIWRPAELATDTALVIDAIRYTLEQVALDGYNPAAFVLLEATSPVRRVRDLDLAIEWVLQGEAESVISFSETEVSPYRMWKVDEASGAIAPYVTGGDAFLPRQAQPKAYQGNGQIYAVSTAALAGHPELRGLLLPRTKALVTPRSMAIDIDEPFDLFIAEQVLRFHQEQEAAE